MAEYNEALSEISGYPKALSHAGAGGGANLKTLNIVNNTANNLFFYNCIVNGYWNAIAVNAGETAAVQYVAPAVEGVEGPPFIISIGGTLTNVSATVPDGVTYTDGQNGINISKTAADGATVTFTGGIG